VPSLLDRYILIGLPQPESSETVVPIRRVLRGHDGAPAHRHDRALNAAIPRVASRGVDSTDSGLAPVFACRRNRGAAARRRLEQLRSRVAPRRWSRRTAAAVVRTLDIYPDQARVSYSATTDRVDGLIGLPSQTRSVTDSDRACSSDRRTLFAGSYA
jgi:hypothetical protein